MSKLRNIEVYRDSEKLKKYKKKGAFDIIKRFSESIVMTFPYVQIKPSNLMNDDDITLNLSDFKDLEVYSVSEMVDAIINGQIKDNKLVLTMAIKPTGKSLEIPHPVYDDETKFILKSGEYFGVRKSKSWLIENENYHNAFFFSVDSLGEYKAIQLLFREIKDSSKLNMLFDSYDNWHANALGYISESPNRYKCKVGEEIIETNTSLYVLAFWVAKELNIGGGGGGGPSHNVSPAPPKLD